MAAASRQHSAARPPHTSPPIRQSPPLRLLAQICVRAEQLRASDNTSPVSLLELLEAADAIFERRRVSSVDAAECRRLLLALAIDPEPDWRRKLRRLEKSERIARERRNSSVDDLRISQSGRRASVLHGEVDERVSHDLFEAVKTVAMSSLSAGASDATTRSPEPVRVAPAPRPEHWDRRDLFSDMLPYELDDRDKQIRDGTRTQKESATRGAVTTSAAGNSRRRRVASPNSSRHRAATYSATATQHVSSSADQRFKSLATTFENWKAVHAVSRIVKQKKLLELRVSQATMPPICTRALFRWIRRTLPEVHTFRTECEALPTAVLRRVSPCSTDTLSVIRFFTHRLEQWTLRTIVRRWRDDTRKKRLLFVKAKIRQRTQVLDTAFACLRQWALYTEAQRCLREKSAWVRHRQDRMCARACLRVWRSRLRGAQRMRDATRSHHSRLLRRSFTEWKQAYAMSRSAVSLHSRATKRSMFSRWRRHSSHVRSLKTKLVTWLESSTEREKRLVLQGWRHVTLQTEQQRHVVAQLQHRHGRRRLRLLFDEWAGWREAKRARVAAVLASTERRHDRIVATIFSSWCSHFALSQRLDAALVCQVLRIEKRRWWSSWRKTTQLRQTMRLLYTTYASHLKALCFSMWSTLVQRKLRNTDTLTMLLSQRRKRTLEVCWETLLTHACVKQAQRSSATELGSRKAMVSASVHLCRWRQFVRARVERNRRGSSVARCVVRRGLLSRSWKVWASAYQARRETRIIDQIVADMRRRRCFRSWQRRWAQTKLKRARLSRAMKALERFRLECMVRSWRRRVATKKELIVRKGRCEKRRSTRCLESCWCVWRREFTRRVRQAHQVTAVLCRWQNQQLQSAFLKWKTRWRLRRDYRRLLARVVASSKEKTLEAFFRGWKTRWSCKRTQRQAVEDAAMELRCRRLRRVIALWRQRSRSSKKLSSSLRSCLHLWRHARLDSVFRRWKLHRLECVVMKTLSKQADAHFSRHLLTVWFRAWRKWRLARRHERDRHGRLCDLMQRWRASNALGKLRETTTRAKRLKQVFHTAARRSDHSVRSSLFVSWKRFVVRKKRRRNMHSESAGKMDAFRLERCVRRLEQYLRLRRLLKTSLRGAVKFSHAASLQRALTAWKLLVERQRLHRELKQKATIFRALSLLPRHLKYWQRFVCSRRRNHALMMRAAGLLSHQREARSFRAWRGFVSDVKRMRLAVTRWRSRVQWRCFEAWTRFCVLCVRRRRDIDRGDTFHSRRTRLRAMRAWRLTARRSRLHQHFSQAWRLHHSRRAFDAWTRFMRVTQVARSLLARRQSALAMRVLTAWRQRIDHEAMYAQRIRLRFVALWKTDLTTKTWAAWKVFVVRTLRVRVRQRQQQRNSVKLVFQAWHRFRMYHQHLRIHSRCVSHQAAEQLIRSRWRHWRRRKQLRNSVESLRDAILARRQHALMQQAARSWHEAAARSRTIKQRIHTKRLELLSRVFCSGWRRFLAEHREEKHQLQQLKRAHETFLSEWLAREVHTRVARVVICEDVKRASCIKRLVAATWQAWVEFHEHKRRQRVAMQQFLAQVVSLAAAPSGESSALAFGDALKRMLVRWGRLGEVRVFEAWAVAAHTLHVERAHMLLALETWQTTQTTRFFSRWRSCSALLKQQRVVATMAVASRTSRYWQRWRVLLDAARRKKTARQRAVAWSAQRVLRRHFRTWTYLAKRTREQRDLVRQLYAVSCSRLAGEVFDAWKRFAVSRGTKRLQTTVALAMHRARLARECWSTWRVFTGAMQYHRRQMQANTERLQVLLLCSVFRGWREWATRKRKTATIARALSTKCDARTAAVVLHAWRGHSHLRATLRLNARTFERFQALQRGLRALQHFAARRKLVSAALYKAQLFFAVLREQRVASSFIRWRHFSRASRKTRLARRHFETRRLLPASWRAWRRFVQSSKAGASRVAKAALAWKNALLRRAWNALVLHHSIKSQRQRDVLAAEQHHTVRVLADAIKRWRRTAAYSSCVRAVGGRVLRQWKLRAVYRCFSCWSGVVRYKRELQRRESVVRATTRVLMVLRAWGVWRKLFVVERAGQRRRLQRCWVAWREFCASQRALASFQRAIEATYLRSAQKRLLQQWKQLIVENKLRRAMVLLSTGFASTQISRRAFDCWRKAAANARADKDKIKAVLIRMQFHRQLSVLFCLRAHAAHQRRKRSLAERARAQHVGRLKTRTLREWRRCVATAKTHRSKLAYYVNVLQHSVQRKTFASWRGFTDRRRELKIKTAKILALHSQLSSRVAWDAWAAFSAKRRKNRRATQLSASNLTKRSLQQWRKFLVLCKVEAMMGAGDKRRSETCFVAWRRSAALSRTVRSFQRSAQRRQSLALVRCCLLAWRHRSSVQRHCKQILCSAANGGRVRFRFLLWKQFASHRKRLKRLLLPLGGASAGSSLSVSTGSAGLGEDGDGNRVEAAADGEDSSSGAVVVPVGEEELALGSIAVALARKARIFQRFEVEWGVETCWQRWRHAFHARLFFRLRKLHHHFSLWQAWSDSCRRVRWVIQRFDDRRITLSVTAVFRSWRDVVRSVRALQQQRIRDRELWTIVATEMARKERKCVKAHWRAWRFVVEEKRHLRTSLELYQHARLLTKYWLVWTHDYLHAVRCGRQRERQHEQQMTRFRQRRALLRLVKHHTRSKRARLVLEYFANKRYDKRVPEILTHWRALVEKTQRVRLFSNALMRRPLERSFCSWVEWKRSQRVRRAQVASLMTKNRETAASFAWLRWRTFVTRQREKQERYSTALTHLVRSRLRRRWFQRVLERKALEARTAHAMTVLAHGRARYCVDRWRSHSTSSRLQRLCRRFRLRKHLLLWRWSAKNEIATRFEQFLLRSRVKKMLTSWRLVAGKHSYWRQLCADMIHAHTVRRTRAYWTRWRRFSERQRRSGEAAKHFQLRLRGRALGALFNFAQSAKNQREVLAERADLLYSRSLRRRAWTQWGIGVQAQRKKRFSLLACMVKLSSLTDCRVMEVVWRSWRRWIERERQCRDLQQVLWRRSLARVLQVWRAQAAAKQQSQERLTQAECYHSSRLKSVAFFYWQNYALAWKDVSDANKQQTIESATPTSPRVLQLPRRELVAVDGSRNLGIAIENEVGSEDGIECVARQVRPLSPVMKRLRQKNGVIVQDDAERGASEFFTVGCECVWSDPVRGVS